MPCVLVIDDDQAVHDLVARALAPRIADRVLSARRPGDGIRMALEERPDVVLLDVNMPGMDGFKVCRLLKENTATRHVPVLFLTVEQNVVHLARALDCGASDYIRKPVNPIELEARVRVAFRDKQLVDLLREQARIDALTGLLNRAALDDALTGAAAAWERNGTPVALLLLDVDRFKEINDTAGHGVGDEVLRAVGRTVRACSRPYDTACRFGGDEFAVVFAQVDAKSALCAARRLMDRLRSVEAPTGAGRRPFTVSAGLVSVDGVEGSFAPPDLFKAADAALYAAKRAGRDRLVVGDAPPGLAGDGVARRDPDR